MPENGLFVVGSALWPWGLGGTFSLEFFVRFLFYLMFGYSLPWIFAISVTPAIQGNYFVFAYASLKY